MGIKISYDSIARQLLFSAVWKYVSAIFFICLGWYLNDYIIDFRYSTDNDGTFINIILGSLPNFIAALFLPIIFTLVRHTETPLKDGGGVCCGLVIYEFIQILPGAVFDFFDVISTVFGYLFFIFILKKFLYFREKFRSKDSFRTAG